MAISVISSASASTAAASALAGGGAASGPSSGFADLLFSQLGAAVGGLVKPVAGTAAETKASDDKEAPLDPNLLATDPTLAFLMAAPVPQAPAMSGVELAPDPKATSATAAETAATFPAGVDAALTARQLAAQATASTGNAPAAGRAENKDGATTSSPQTPFADLLAPGGSTAETVSAALAKLITPPSRPAATGETGKKADNSAPLLAGSSTAQEGLSRLDDDKAGHSVLESLSAQRDGTALQSRSNDSQSLPANIAVESPSGQDSALLAAGAGQQAAKSEAAAQTKTDVATPLHSSTWANDFSNKVVWLARNDQQSAQININPPQLGPIQITLQMNGDQASAVFGSPHAEVRQAIENSLPQLKEMLSTAGINLGQADVGANMAQQNRQMPFQAANGNRSASENAILPGIANTANGTSSPPIQRGRGMVDLFA